VADHTAALILAGLRRVSAMDRDLHNGVWDRKRALEVGRLWGKTLGILGFGRIGQAVARRMAPFGFRMVTYDPYLDPAAAQLCGVTPVSFEDLLTQSDVITIHALLTDHTYHLLGEAEFARMKPGAYLVNTARGAVIDEPALIAALRAGHLSGAALDVMETEPLPAGSPLANMDNVLLTPHLASFSREAAAQLYQRSAEVAAALLAGQWTRTIVNPQVRALAESRFGPFRG
jgi:D-3-phosphoglycerate dehydrogenase / 2-oxoglutarate reductase